MKIDAAATKEAIREALRAYTELGSPTGIAACEIERGWMRWITPSCGKLDPPAERLTKIIDGMLGDPRRREVLLLDAWLPPMLQAFAKEVAPGLLANARKVSRAAAASSPIRGTSAWRRSTRAAIVTCAPNTRRRAAPR
ncbi:MAG: hypothetical protein JSS68_11875 [Actinobacteria bacterium]|nr:hypothetical protein [Actinomycetota bacterium]